MVLLLKTDELQLHKMPLSENVNDSGFKTSQY